MSLLTLTELWANTPQPHQVSAPSRPSMRVRRQPKSRFRQEMRASDPMRPLDQLGEPLPSLYLLAGGAGSTLASTLLPYCECETRFEPTAHDLRRSENRPSITAERETEERVAARSA
jgi:hypothetical protein